MVLVGCRPKGRSTEQHDVFFGIGPSIKSLVPQMNDFWPDSGGLHIDAWREVTAVDGYSITVRKRTSPGKPKNQQLYFINLGGYKPEDFEEYHYKILTVGATSSDAIKTAKQSAFYKHTGLNSPGGGSHIDDKYGIDLDDFAKVEELLPEPLKKRYAIKITRSASTQDDTLHIGYVRLSKLK